MANAGLTGSELVSDGSMGVACGSCIGSTADLLDFAQMLIHGDGRQVNANSYIRMMPHTAAANIGIFFGMKGRVIPTNSACTSGSQAIGYAYEAIQHGYADAHAGRRCRGAVPHAGQGVRHLVRHQPAQRRAHARSPRPYDAERDGLVVGEGARVPGARGARGRARARRDDPCGDHRLLDQQRRHARDAPRGEHHARRHGERAGKTARITADAGRLREWPRHRHHARRPGRVARHQRGVRAATCPSARRRVFSATRSAPAARSRPGSASR